jgi:hypothetical protein
VNFRETGPIRTPTPATRFSLHLFVWRTAMAKTPISIAYEIPPARPKSRRWRIGTIFLLAAIIVPLVVEGAALSYGQWCSITGSSTRVSTPVMDTVANAFHETKSALEDLFSPSFTRVFREPAVALPVALVLIVCGMMLLRR